MLDEKIAASNDRVYNDAKVRDHFAIIPTGTMNEDEKSMKNRKVTSFLCLGEKVSGKLKEAEEKLFSAITTRFFGKRERERERGRERGREREEGQRERTSEEKTMKELIIFLAAFLPDAKKEQTELIASNGGQLFRATGNRYTQNYMSFPLISLPKALILLCLAGALSTNSPLLHLLLTSNLPIPPTTFLPTSQ